MKFSSVTGAYSSIVNGLIRDCQTTNELQTLDSIEDKYESAHAMFMSIAAESNCYEAMKMRDLKNALFESFEKARHEAFARLINI